MQTIKDGTGTGLTARVDKQNRLHTNAITFSEFQAAALAGDAYNISTGVINLTSANESALWFLKNISDIPIVIKEILVIPQESDGAGNAVIRVYRNPTSGTIIDNESAVATLANRNFGSAKPLDGITYKGAEGDTIIGGSTFAISSRSNFDSPIAFDAEIIVLENSNTITVSWQPPAGNTSQNVVVACTLIEERLDFNGNQDS